ncbi:DUF1877 family protein [Streptomyces sp. NBC_01288]|uniref:DUF1877 family protein n=1 Tax=Streptomyces sp. NBC_01288 TaxID=2903814 RepID=UPI002E15F752|nr:DUF1877 family protein [Streptomyces sp. NBC_01288]
MALTQQFARVTPDYLDRCRTSALTSPGASPGWDPPDGDLLDTGWALWGLIRYCRSTGADPEVIALLDRAVSGDPDEDAGFLDHDEVYDGFGDPPRLLAPAAVADASAALDRLQLGDLLVDMPASAEVAAAVCGFGPRSDIEVREHLTEHFVALREFYRTAARHTQCVVTWVD